MNAALTGARWAFGALVLAAAVIVGLLSMHSLPVTAESGLATSTASVRADDDRAVAATLPSGTPEPQCADQCQTSCPTASAACVADIPAAPPLHCSPNAEPTLSALAHLLHHGTAPAVHTTAIRPPSLVAMSISRT
jgi:hypothetical protein